MSFALTLSSSRNSLVRRLMSWTLWTFCAGGTPSLKLLWLNHEPGTQARRVEVLLACFDLSSSSEELQAVESPFQALCCLLAYLFVQVTWAPCGRSVALTFGLHLT